MKQISVLMLMGAAALQASTYYVTIAGLGGEPDYEQRFSGWAKDIDKALKLGLNHPMGPFELVDLVGLDTRLNILEYLHKSLGEKYRPAPLLVQYVKAGRLGRKSGRGVYEYPEIEAKPEARPTEPAMAASDSRSRR